MYKRKIFTTVVLLAVCFAMLVWSSYAWLTLSLAPEIVGIDTQVSANGSLEIALLSETTYMDPTKIRTVVGDSAVVQKPEISNLSWGNVIDLSGEAYGMDKISMLPAKLTVFAGERGQGVVANNMLGTPEYRLDGRISTIHADTVSAVYEESAFVYAAENQRYGVRAIGTVSNLSQQQTALATARTAVPSYMTAAASVMESTWRDNGADLLQICLLVYYAAPESQIFDQNTVNTLQDTARRLDNGMGYIDSAVRQGIIGYLASVLQDAETFAALRSTLENTSIPLSVILNTANVELPGGMIEWVEVIEDSRLSMQGAMASCKALKGGSYRVSQIKPILEQLISVDAAYLNERRMSEPEAYSGLTADNILTLTPQAGLMADAADFVGNWSAYFSYDSVTHVEVESFSLVEKPYLQELSELLMNCDAAAGNTSLLEAPLEDIYGFAVDFAFRTNVAADLLLQTEAVDRVSQEPALPSLEGGGSYMAFSSEQLTTEQIVFLMDAIRIAFVDKQNQIIAMAKLNTSNFTEAEGEISAPIYLYDYTLTAAGDIVMGERREEDREILFLSQNTPTVLTAIVWLDGENVTNSNAAISKQSMSGVLNLQFASSADMVSADLLIDAG